MNSKFPTQMPDNKTVYVKRMEVADLPDEVQEEAGELTHLYAVHDAAGQQLVLVADRNMAFVLARQHDMLPHTVH